MTKAGQDLVTEADGASAAVQASDRFAAQARAVVAGGSSAGRLRPRGATYGGEQARPRTAPRPAERSARRVIVGHGAIRLRGRPAPDVDPAIAYDEYVATVGSPGHGKTTLRRR